MASRSAIVIGAGVFGASLADCLASRGWNVRVVEQYAPANARSSSGDSSRLLRFVHGGDARSDAWYTRSALSAAHMWRALAREENRTLVTKTGAVWFVRNQDSWGDAVLRSTQGNGARCQAVSVEELRPMFPSIYTDDLLCALYEPDAAVLNAAECVRTLMARAVRHGATLVHGTARPSRDSVIVADEVLSADRIIWACGAWLGALFPEHAPVEARRQMVYYWDTAPEWSRGPAWVDNAASVYGIPDVDGSGMKAQNDVLGPVVRPDATERPLDPRPEKLTREYLTLRFPALADVPLLRAYGMNYETTPDGNFLLGPLEGGERVWLMGGGSGHGFKHGPAFGAYVADAIEGSVDVEPWLLPSPSRSSRKHEHS